MPSILSRLSILFINDISRDLDNTEIQAYTAFRSVPGCQTCMFCLLLAAWPPWMVNCVY